jgi:hypothetical protein
VTERSCHLGIVSVGREPFRGIFRPFVRCCFGLSDPEIPSFIGFFVFRRSFLGRFFGGFGGSILSGFGGSILSGFWGSIFTVPFRSAIAPEIACFIGFSAILGSF